MLDSFLNETIGYANWLWSQITFQTPGLWGNYFWFLTLISVLFMLLEWNFPWRKNQPKIRKDFWLDAFYMYFNYFIFSLIGFAGLAHIVSDGFTKLLNNMGLENIVALKIGTWAYGWQLFLLFVVKDFFEWSTHRLLHRFEFLWQFHKVHHSVEEMGFAAHLRFHWFETIMYKSITYLPLAMIGFSTTDFFLVHAFTTFIGHWNHANFRIPIGPLKYILNNPDMHMWHHAKNLPSEKRMGINFGITLSLWDYLFGTAHTPSSGKEIELGFDGMEKFPKKFTDQILHPWKK